MPEFMVRCGNLFLPIVRADSQPIWCLSSRILNFYEWLKLNFCARHEQYFNIRRHISRSQDINHVIDSNCLNSCLKLFSPLISTENHWLYIGIHHIHMRYVPPPHIGTYHVYIGTIPPHIYRYHTSSRIQVPYPLTYIGTIPPHVYRYHTPSRI